MLRNCVVLAFRHLLKNKLVSLINIGGLSIALAFGMLAVIFVYNELTYDSFHVNANRIYRIRQRVADQYMTRTPWSLGPAISSILPDATVVRIYRSRGSISQGDKSFRLRVSYVDPSFLDVFSFPMALGDASTALRDLRSIVITENLAGKLFPEANPVGKVVNLNQKEAYQVTGILSRLPENSSINFDCLVPADAANEVLDSWASSISVRPQAAVEAPAAAAVESLSSILGTIPVATTFVLLPQYLEPRYIEERISKVAQKAGGQQATTAISLSLQPLNEVHFDQYKRTGQQSTKPVYIFVFCGIALIVITISCVNFSVLAIGRSFLRAKETAVRRLFGAQRRQLVSQYLVESVLMAVMGLIAGLILMHAILPSLNSLVGTNISLYGQLSVTTSLCVLLLTVTIGIFAGFYPALALSRLQPVEVLYARSESVNPGFFMRLLLVIQIAMSMALLMVALAMAAQLDLVADKTPGFRTDGVIVVDTGQLPETSPSLVDVYVHRIASNPSVRSVARGEHPLSDRQSFQGFIVAEGRTIHGVETIPVDYGFLTTLKFGFLEGRDFSRSISTDRNAVIVNQALMKQFGWRRATGKVLNWNGSAEVSIVGVIRDFHFRSFHQSVAPAFVFLDPGYCSKLFVVSTTSDDRQIMDSLRKEWRKIVPSQTFRATFLSDDLKNQYETDEKWLNAIQLSAVLAFCLACLGAYGSTLFAVARRKKEIGIRKVFGTPLHHLMARLNFDFIKIVIVATIFAAPIAYLFSKEWLQNFVYRIDLAIPIIAGSLFTFAFVILTVSCKTYKAATLNPVETLRSE